MKIYTKTGDKGETSLIGGTRVSKADLRIESYGTVDELNSYVGYAATCFNDEDTLHLLLRIQSDLFTIGSRLASIPGKAKMTLPELDPKGISEMEEEIDRINELLPPLKNFILPGGSRDVAMIHIARCVCRRAERKVIELASTVEVDNLIIKYLNRLSDLLFILARYACLLEGAKEIPWKPRG